MQNFFSYEHSKDLDIAHFKGYILKNISSSNSFLYNIREPKYKQNNIGYLISRRQIVQYLYLYNLIPHFDLLIFQLLDIVQKCFCIPDRAMDPIFQMKYASAFYHTCSRRNKANTDVHFCMDTVKGCFLPGDTSPYIWADTMIIFSRPCVVKQKKKHFKSD